MDFPDSLCAAHGVGVVVAFRSGSKRTCVHGLPLLTPRSLHVWQERSLCCQEGEFRRRRAAFSTSPEWWQEEAAGALYALLVVACLLCSRARSAKAARRSQI